MGEGEKQRRERKGREAGWKEGEEEREREGQGPYYYNYSCCETARLTDGALNEKLWEVELTEKGVVIVLPLNVQEVS